MNKLPIKVQNNWFSRIKLFFKNLVNRKNIENNVEHTQIDANSNVRKTNNFKENVQKEVKVYNAKQDILKLIDKEPGVISTLSTEKLMEISKLYDEDIKLLENKIAYLERKKKEL